MLSKHALTTLAVGLAACFAPSAFAQTNATYQYMQLKKGLTVTAASPSSPAPAPTPAAPPAVPKAQLSTASIDFGAHALGSSSTGQVLLENQGNAMLSLTSGPTVTGDASFDLGGTSCGSSLAAGASCLTDIRFTPSQLNAVSGQVRFTSNDAAASLTVNLSGSGLAPVVGFLDGAAAAISSLSFPDTVIGVTASALSVTVKNVGNQALVLGNPGLSLAPPFALSSNGCSASTLAPGASCQVQLTFTPTAAQTYSDAGYGLTTQSNAAAARLGLSGKGINGTLSVTSVVPNKVELAGGLPKVQVNGTNFTATTQVLIGGVSTSCTLDSAISLTCAPPARASEGTATLTLQDSGDGRTATLASGLQYTALDVASLSLTSVSTLGGQSLLVNGKGFMPGATATLKGLALPCTVTSNVLLTCVTPAATAGTGNLVITNLNGSTVTKASAVTYAVPTTYSNLDAGKKASSITLSGDLLTASTSSTSWNSVYATLPKSSGKYYIEVLHNSTQTAVGILGSQETSTSGYAGSYASGVQYLSTGSMAIGGTNMSGPPSSAASGTLIGMAVDLDNKTLRFQFKPAAGVCGALSVSYSFATGLFPTNPAAFLPVLSLQGPSSGTVRTATANFGQSAFTCTVPSGYKAGWF